MYSYVLIIYELSSTLDTVTCELQTHFRSSLLRPEIRLLFAGYRHGSSATFETKSSYCLAKVEFNSINLVQHGSSTTFETGLKQQQSSKVLVMNTIQFKVHNTGLNIENSFFVFTFLHVVWSIL